VLIRDWDLPADEAEWRAFVAANAFGHLVAGGRDREVPVVVPTQFVLDGDQVVLHLAKPNPIWGAIEENPTVLLSVAGDWTYIPSDWKAIGDEDPRRGVPTTYYAAAQLIGRARVVEEPAGVAEVLRAQLADLQPDVDAIDPEDHGAKLRAIRGLRIEVTEVRAKFKYGANVDADHRAAVRDRLVERDGPGDRAAARHVERRL
jgi:transcriptional regulator